MTDILDSQSHVNTTCLQLLLQEVVPTSIRVSHRLNEAKGNKLEEPEIGQETTILHTPLSLIPNDIPGTVLILDSPTIHHDDVTLRIENHGYLLGLKIANLLLFKNGNNSSKIVDILDIMKFVCRDVWKCLYNKQMDNLRTNHRGTFVLVDNLYKLIANLCSPKGHSDTLQKAKAHLWFPCGIIRGILMSFGTECQVSAEITQFPVVTFNIHTAINN